MNRRTARKLRAGIVAANQAATAPLDELGRRAYRVRILQLIEREAPAHRAREARLFARHTYA